MINLCKEVFDQISSAYEMMSTTARYRPSAPSDGFGNITVPASELNLEKEQNAYAKSWWKEEDDRVFFMGCCDFRTRRATIFAVEAARQMMSGALGQAVAARLLKMASEELARVVERSAA